MKKIAIVTARSGSKGLPNKNVLLVDGKPLMAYSIEAALAAGIFEKIIVSTDSQEYIDMLSHYPIEFVKREPHLATDTSTSFQVIEDVIQRYSHLEYDYFVLFQPTSPLRTAEHTIEACNYFEKHFNQYDLCASVTNAHKPTVLTRHIEEDMSMKHFELDYSVPNRQRFKPEYSPNGAFFIAKPQAYLEVKHFYGPRSIAFYMDKNVSVDVDDKDDFDYFYYVVMQRKQETIRRENVKHLADYLNLLPHTKGDMTIIGETVFKGVRPEKIGTLTLNYLDIPRILTSECRALLVNDKFADSIGEKVILMVGANDMIQPDFTNDRQLTETQALIDKIHALSPSTKVYILEILPVSFRADRSNETISSCNSLLKEKLQNATWISTDGKLCDKYGKLSMGLSQDGLHLNDKGADILLDILEAAVK